MKSPFTILCLFFYAIGCSALLVLQTACTTNLKTSTDAYHAGDFAKANEEIEKSVPDNTEAKASTDPAIKVQYDRDLLWAGLEKAKINQDDGKFKKSLKLYQYLQNRAEFLRTIESNYARNPADMKNWDAGQFMQDAGQAVVGADQTDYVLQPYEMILINAYAMLDAIMEKDDAAPYARTAVRLQELERDDLKRVGVEVTQPNADKVDSALHSKAPQLAGFNIGSVFGADGFTNANAALSEAIRSAKEARAADPRVTLACVLEWAAYLIAGDFGAAETAAKMVRETSGASKLADALQAVKAQDDFVLVLVGAGRAPERDSFKVRVPIPIPNIATGYFVGVYPFLKFRTENRPNQITITSQSGTNTLEVIDSIDAIMAKNFQRREVELWWIPTIRAIIRTAASMAAQAAMNKNDKNAGYAKLGILLANLAVAEAEQADLRVWSTLPGAHYAALVKRPTDGVLNIEIGDGSTKSKVSANVKEGSSLVYIRALTPNMHTKAYVASLMPKSSKESKPDAATEMPAPVTAIPNSAAATN